MSPIGIYNLILFRVLVTLVKRAIYIQRQTSGKGSPQLGSAVREREAKNQDPGGFIHLEVWDDFL